MNAPVNLELHRAAVDDTRGADAPPAGMHQLAGPALDRALAELDGGFALAWRDGERTVLAVDRFARRSLCYRIDGTTLHWAARADDAAGDAGSIDPQAIYDYLYFHAIPAPRTVFRGVLRVPPGHVAEFVAGRLSLRPYWRPSFGQAAREPFERLAERFRSLLEESVAAELDGGKPACFLSGGTDSSTVAGMIRRATGQRPATYSIGFDAAGYDEMAYARLAARHFDTEHHEFYVTPDDLVRDIPRVAASYDQPFGNSSALPAFSCAAMARADGVGRILAGDGGDELFGGNTRYAKQRVFALYDRVPLPLRRGLLEPLAASTSLRRLPLLRKAASYVDQARIPMPARMETYNLLMRLGPADMLSERLLEQVDAQAPARLQQQVWDGIEAPNLLDHQLAYDWRFTLAENDLPKVVGSAALAGLEVGFPLLSNRLLDFSIGLQAGYKLRGLKLRWFFKQALRGFLPDEIIAKQKHGFGLPFGVWAVNHAGLSALARSSLEALVDRRIIRPAFVHRLLNEHLPAHPGYYGEIVWLLLVLEQWIAARASTFRM